MSDSYQTVARSITVKSVINRSEFLAHVKEVATEEEAREFISAIKEEHKQATHNCSAFCIGLPPREVTFADDNGEPSGTAGKPILGAIKSSEITNVVVVVTRYFGGKKLGVRGLIEAYGGVAKDAIRTAGIVTRVITSTFAVKCDYPALNSVMYHLNKYEAEIVESDYGVKARLKIAVRESLAKELKAVLEQFGLIE
ncbi:YigZ family protein [Zhaonella formicivorans]|jgi:uncharacterized YigZ family protein|uniref:YigZ family protein n=1 Tax=Zhaonella formicivorans TaxID=2528593 RepID=UPI0010EE497A|nr:YigZ family protein [Zhaonella formicivorans]